jgi:calcineurin-like phosphoesterase family protein
MKGLKNHSATLAVVTSALFLTSTSIARQAGHELSFGVIADCQYCASETTGVRHYSLSADKLKDCVSNFNSMPLDYVIHLGDLINHDIKSYDVVLPVFDALSMPKYHVLGNHDFSVADELKHEIPQRLGMPSKYYDFTAKGWRFVVLDGNDISFHAYPKNSIEYMQVESYYSRIKPEPKKWNGAVGKQQLDWLESVLQKAAEQQEKVVIYCHYPVYPENPHNLWNAAEIIQLLEQHACVKAYINGHNHKGGYGIKNGIHYLTLQGMVDTTENSYATVNVFSDRLEVVGYGREQNRMMNIK